MSPTSRLPLDPYLPAIGNPLTIEYDLQHGRVSQVRVSLGYAQRGIEHLAKKQNIWQNLILLQRICGICPISHTLCFCQTLESLAKVQIPRRAAYLRTLVAEIERIQSHLLPLICLAAHLNASSSCLRLLFEAREAAAAMLCLLTGKRVNYDVNQIGGVRVDLKKAEVAKTMLSMLGSFDRPLDEARGSLLRHERLKGLGFLSSQAAESSQATGPVARASGLARDLRKEGGGYAAYPELKFQIPTSSGGDVLARYEIRILEIIESIRMIRQILSSLPQGKLSVDPPPLLLPGQAAGSVEAPRGENHYQLTLSAHLQIEQIKITTPTEYNLEALKMMLMDAQPEDVPLIVASADPCYACLER